MIPIKNAQGNRENAAGLPHGERHSRSRERTDSARASRRRKSIEAAADFMAEAGVKSAFLGYRLGHRVFPGNICISLNDEIVHGIGSQRRIQYGDIVKLDIGVIQDGWVGDTATTVPVGSDR